MRLRTKENNRFWSGYDPGQEIVIAQYPISWLIKIRVNWGNGSATVARRGIHGTHFRLNIFPLEHIS